MPMLMRCYLQKYLNDCLNFKSASESDISEPDRAVIMATEDMILTYDSLTYVLEHIPTFEQMLAFQKNLEEEESEFNEDEECEEFEYPEPDDEWFELDANVEKMLEIISLISEDDYNVLIDDVSIGEFLSKNIQKLRKKYSEVKENKKNKWNEDNKNYALSLFKSPSSEHLKPVKLSIKEKGVFGSELLGYRQLQTYYEGSVGGEIKTYHFDNTEQILNLNDIQNSRVWMPDKTSEPYQPCNKKESKAAIVDILQENLRRYYANEALIPLEFVMKRTVGAITHNQMDGLRGKNLQSSGASKYTQQEENSLTGAELRVVWRLMNELGDSVIRHILTNTVIAVHVHSELNNDGTFCITDVNRTTLPWDNEGENNWQARARKHGPKLGKMYDTRHYPDLNWISRLLWFKNTMSEKPHTKDQALPAILVNSCSPPGAIQLDKYELQEKAPCFSAKF